MTDFAMTENFSFQRFISLSLTPLFHLLFVFTIDSHSCKNITAKKFVYLEVSENSNWQLIILTFFAYENTIWHEVKQAHQLTLLLLNCLNL